MEGLESRFRIFLGFFCSKGFFDDTLLARGLSRGRSRAAALLLGDLSANVDEILVDLFERRLKRLLTKFVFFEQ